MKQMTEREIKDLLTPSDRPQPPAGLAERIKSEIPDQITLDDTESPEAFRPTRMSRSRVWLLAASVSFALGGGFLAYRVWERMPDPDPAPAAESQPATVAEAPADIVTPAGEPRANKPKAGAAAASPSTASEDRRARTPEPGSRAEAAEGLRRSEKASRLGDDALARGRVSELPAESQDPRLDAAGDRDAVSLSVELNEVVNELSSSMRDAAEMDKERRQVGLEEQERFSFETQPTPAPAAEQPAAVRPPPPPPPPPAIARRLAPPKPKAKRVESLERQARTDALKSLAYASNARVDREQARVAPSTGGTAEPNDAPYGDVFFHDTGTNPFIDTEDDRLSTFGLDVDTGSYTVTRRYLRDGHLPPREAVRVEELINYFDYRDAAPETRDFAIHAEGAPSIYGQGERYYLLRFNIRGRDIQAADRRPAVLTFVVDVSGSMAQENRLGLVKQSLALLIDQLRADDRMALVVYGSRGRVLLEPTSDRRAMRRAIEQLRTGGATNAEEGLTLAYELAARHRRPGTINRVILCSDGVANVGRTSAGSILERIRRAAGEGIELTTVGFGMGNYNDVMMERLADEGNGRYAYVDTLGEARRIFVENLTGTLQTIAAEARAQVSFNPDTVARYRLLGYENRDIADQRFRDDTVDAGEIGAGHSVTALYEIKLHEPPRARDEIAALTLRYGSIDRGEMVELDRKVTGADFAGTWANASPALRLTSLVAEFAEILKRSYWARSGDLDDVFRRAQRLSVEFEGDPEVADFVSLIGRAAQYWRDSPR